MKTFLVVLALAVATVSAGVADFSGLSDIVPVNEINGEAEVTEFEPVVHPKDLPVVEEGDHIEGRITNGYAAQAGKVPYIVGLSFRKGGSGWWCGGSIIGNTWVLTAAHCTSGADSVTIYYGALRRLQAQFTHTVGRGNFRQHAGYNSNTLNNDISLIATPHVGFNSAVNKVALPSFNNRNANYANTWAMAAGWGKTSNNGQVSDQLNCVNLLVIDNASCARVYGSTTVTNNLICTATTGGKSTCSGDSGGPLVSFNNNRLIGVTSFVSGNGCTAGQPAGFSRVTGYLDWIRSISGIAYY